MLFLNIASGSKGNVSLVSYGNVNLLIDAGLSLKQIELGLKKANKKLSEITDLIITHEHIDHVKGLLTFINNYEINLYMTKGTATELKINNHIEIMSLESFKIDELTITPLPLSHDAREPIGLIITNTESSLCYITDTGYIHSGMIDLLKNHNLYYLESNHDPYRLTKCNRPPYIINRISDKKGHLSNYDSAYQFSLMMGPNTKHLIHAHISEDCNSYDLIENTFNEVLAAQNVNDSHVLRYFAKQDEALEVIYL